MKKIATLLLVCFMVTMLMSMAVVAEEQKSIPEDTKVITIYSGDVEKYFNVYDKQNPIEFPVDKKKKKYTRGEAYIAYPEALLSAEGVLRGDGTVGIGQEYMGYLCVYMSYGPPALSTYSALYDPTNKVFYYFPQHAFKIEGNEMLLREYRGFEGGRSYYPVIDSKAVPKAAAGAASGAPSTTPSTTTPVATPATITVTYNGELINFDQPPVAENGRTLVPLRAIFEKLGATVAWDGNTQTVTATKDDVVITLTLNNTTATKNGQPVVLDVPAKAINGRTLVPVRFIADCFGVTTGWDGALQRVILTK